MNIPIPIRNVRLHHHFKPLSDLLSHPSWTELGFFDTDYTAHKFYDHSNTVPNLIEAYYLKSIDSTSAIGWVHNRNAWVMNNFYLTKATQNYLGCVAPLDTAILLTGFLPDTLYHISWFPTRLNSTVHPVDTVWYTDGDGNLLLDLSTALFGDTIAYYLDTLRSDYAFIITLGPFVKRMGDVAAEVEYPSSDWDFGLFPNPARNEVFIRLPGDAPKDISIYDPSGRQLQGLVSVAGSLQRIPVGHLAQGIYYVWVSDETRSKTKKLIIH